MFNILKEDESLDTGIPICLDKASSLEVCLLGDVFVAATPFNTALAVDRCVVADVEAVGKVVAVRVAKAADFGDVFPAK